MKIEKEMQEKYIAFSIPLVLIIISNFLASLCSEIVLSLNGGRMNGNDYDTVFTSSLTNFRIVFTIVAIFLGLDIIICKHFKRKIKDID